MERVLITGGAGFIGSAVIRHLLKNSNAQILNVDKLTYAGHTSSLKEVSGTPRYRFLKADIADQDTMERAFSEFCPDAVMNLAAESHVDRSIDSAAPFIITNINGTFALLEAARHFRDRLSASKRDSFRFHHISTDEVYGSLGETGLFTESSPYDPRSPYSSSKAASDHLVKAWYHTYGMPVLLTNCSNNYGPYHFPEKLIPLTIINALEGRQLPVYGSGDNVRDWLYVDDHARALELVLRSGQPGETYNIGSNNERTNLQVVHSICDLLDKARPLDNGSYRDLIDFVQDRAGHDKRYAIDATKIKSELNWNALESFESGLEKTVAWYLDNRDWWEPIRRKVYDGSRLGVVENRAINKEKQTWPGDI